MKKNFIKIRNLIRRDLDPKVTRLSEARINRWLLDLPVIHRNIINAMYEEAFGTADKAAFEYSLHQVQEECIFLMNILAGYKNSCEDPPLLYQYVIEVLTALLDHIEKQYSRYFDLNMPISKIHLELGTKEVSGKLNLLIAGLKKRDTDPVLLEILRSSFGHFIDSKACTYQKLIYMKDLQNYLIDMCAKKGEGDFNKRLTTFLIFHRFNDHDFEVYMRDCLSVEVSGYYDLKAQLDRLFELEKEYEDQKETVLGCFDFCQPSLKETLQGDVKSFIKMLKKKLKNRAGKGAAVDLNAHMKSSNYKVRVSIAVPALSCFLRTLVEAGVICIEERSHLLDFVSCTFTTPGKGRNAGVLSFNHLKNTYEKITAAAVKTVKAFVLKILDILNGWFRNPAVC